MLRILYFLPFADTVINPRTMMIKSIDTSVAYIAMPASWSSYDSTVRAQTIWLKLFQQI